jgi:hypothetical protein
MGLVSWECSVATGMTTRIPKRLRALLCVVIALSLNGQLVTVGCSADDRQTSVRILAVAYQSPAVQVNRGIQRFENSKQRNAVDSPFILLAAGDPMPDCGRQAMAADELCWRAFSPAQSQSGRSPPHRIS